jgi:hypothetical protein
VLYPVVYLKTSQDIERFLDSENEFEEDNKFYRTKYDSIQAHYSLMGKKVRIIGFFHDKKEYQDEFKLFKAAA